MNHTAPILSPETGGPQIFVHVHRSGDQRDPDPAEPARTELEKRMCMRTGCLNNQNLKKCSNCNSARYCSPACQKADWKHHKVICKLQTQARNKAPPSYERLNKHLRHFAERFAMSLNAALSGCLDQRSNPTDVTDTTLGIYLELHPHPGRGPRFKYQQSLLRDQSAQRELLSATEGGRAVLEDLDRKREVTRSEGRGYKDCGIVVLFATDPSHPDAGEDSLTMQFEVPLHRRGPRPTWEEDLRAQIDNDQPLDETNYRQYM